MESQNERKELVDIIKNVFGVDIRKKSGERDAVDGRFVFSKILTNRGHRITDLGKFISKHHSSIVHYRNSANDLLETDDLFATKYYTCKDRFMEGKDIYAYIPNKEALINQIDKLILEKNTLTKKLEKYKRLDNIIEFIDSRTPSGKESFIFKKINLMFNGITDYGQKLK